MRERRWALLCCAAAALLGTGCEPTSQDVADKYRDRFTQRRKELAELATRLPPKGSVTQNSCETTPDPRPVYFNKGSWESPEALEALAEADTDVVMAEQLTDPDGSPRWDLFMSDSLVVTLQWTGPRDPSAPSARRATATAGFKNAFERALNLRYIVAARVAEDMPPKILDKQSFLPGRIVLEGFLLDAKTGAVLVHADREGGER
jgi:hypothetical protein